MGMVVYFSKNIYLTLLARTPDCLYLLQEITIIELHCQIYLYKHNEDWVQINTFLVHKKCNYFLILQVKHKFLVLKRTVSMRGFI